MAADLTFDRFTDIQNDQCFHDKLITWAPYLLKRGVYWGMLFDFEDSHHFEISNTLGKQWIANGRPRPGGAGVPAVPAVDRCAAAFPNGCGFVVVVVCVARFNKCCTYFVCRAVCA